ncbi:MAG: hypothetical protein HY300_15590 [Verrucomicrobia bacterium]|nr:hypothetical protein [Verrucomicrobiota bacterium]
MKMNLLVRAVVFAGLLAVAFSHRTTVEAAEAKAVAPAAQYAALVKEHESAMAVFQKAYSQAKNDAERGKIAETYPAPGKFAARFLTIADKYPDDPAALDALVWVVTQARYGKEAERALKTLVERHIKSEKLETVCQMLVYSSDSNGEKTLREIMEKSPHRAVQGQACYSLGRVLAHRGGNAQKEGEDCLERVIEKFGDLKWFRGTLADAAKGDLFELHNLALGKTPPDIEGEDFDGKKFKLSDYRGKVVVIDFFGDW